MNSVTIFLISVALIGGCSALKFPKHKYHPECPIDAGLIYFPHESDCTLFYMCSFGDVTLMECPDDLHFNPIYFNCEFPHLAGCEFYSSTEVPTTLEPECRNSAVSLEPHKTECSKFYVKLSGVSYLTQCDEGKMFDSSTQDCVNISPGGCL